MSLGFIVTVVSMLGRALQVAVEKSDPLNDFYEEHGWQPPRSAEDKLESLIDDNTRADFAIQPIGDQVPDSGARML